MAGFFCENGRRTMEQPAEGVSGGIRRKNDFVLLSAVCYHYPTSYFTIGGCMRFLLPHQWTPMNRLSVTLLLVFVLGLVAFATWKLFAGDLEASFSTFPFLLIIYLFVLKLRRRSE
jgi:hypothetical protein